MSSSQATSILPFISGVPPPPPVSDPVRSLAPSQITGRSSDIMNLGWLGGIGSSFQFQGQNTLLPVRVGFNNRDTEARVLESRGLKTGERLLTRWERPNNFNPGVGTDTWREGQNVTWTMQSRGLQDPLTGVYGPHAYPMRDYIPIGTPTPPYDGLRQGLCANAQPPISLFSTPSGFQAGMSLREMQMEAAAQMKKTRMQAAFRKRAAANVGR